MASQGYVVNLAPQNVGPFTAVTAAAITAIFPDVPIPQGFWIPGKQLRLRAWGTATTASSSQGTFTMKVSWGGAGGTVIATSASQSFVASASTVPWDMEIYLACSARAITASPTWSCFAQGQFRTQSGLVASPSTFVIASTSATAPAAVTGLSDAANGLDCSITMSASTNSFICNLMTLEDVSL